AGLLSSIGESASCMDPKVTKLWYNLNTINYQYDITQTQPQLFVTETFQNLIDVLEAFADTMAFRRGGTESILKAIECKNASTAVYSSGLQLTGVFTDLGIAKNDELTFIKTTGPSALAYNGKQLPGHGKTYHADGFSSPVGKLKDINKPLENHNLTELGSLGIVHNQTANLTFESGIKVNGLVKEISFQDNKLILITFEDCTVKESNGNVLFQPEWGTYDMAVGEKIISVFNGAADKDAYEEITFVSKQETHKITYDSHTQQLHALYQKVRTIRENQVGYDELANIFNELKKAHRSDWLCALEILEIVHHQKIDSIIEKELRVYLEMKAANEADLTKLINDGLHVIANPVSQLITEND
ncbi:MAG TPA: aromatic amino acid hydroxylase, partial [Pedobacter sp.]|nr:aromatic amino acid hydroxylase [Pedobacter sp.]